MSAALGGLGALVLPPGLSPWLAAVLIATSFFASALSAAFGLGGGVLMLAVLASLLPPTTVVPVHGVVQIGSNVGRAALMWRAVSLPLVVPFAFGSVIGAGLGALVVADLPPCRRAPSRW